MSVISAQVSLYPLGQEDLSPAIDQVLSIFHDRGLEVAPGAMSTLVSGDDVVVFSALHAAFCHVANESRLVMVVTFSNACPSARRNEKKQEAL